MRQLPGTHTLLETSSNLRESSKEQPGWLPGTMTSSTSQMIANLGWCPLQQRRNDAKLVMIYRITHSHIDIPADQFLHPVILSTRGPSLRYMLPYCRMDVYRHSFFPAGIRLWNQLLEHVAAAQTLEDFKVGIAGLHYM